MVPVLSSMSVAQSPVALFSTYFVPAGTLSLTVAEVTGLSMENVTS